MFSIADIKNKSKNVILYKGKPVKNLVIGLKKKAVIIIKVIILLFIMVVDINVLIGL